jgi:hypothetical protein
VLIREGQEMCLHLRNVVLLLCLCRDGQGRTFKHFLPHGVNGIA